MTLDRSIILSQHITKAYVILMEIRHPMLESPIRLVNNDEPLISGGYTYSQGYARITLPSTGEGERSASIEVQNVDNRIGLAARSLIGPATVKFSIVRVDSPDAVEASYPLMKISDVNGDRNSIRGNLVSNHDKSEPFPALTVTKAMAPGVFL